MSSFASSFADDTKLVSAIKSVMDAHKFQQDLDSVYDWANQSNMSFNGDKFQLLRYGQDELLKESTSYTDCNGKQIAVTSNAKDLGVLMSSDGTFVDHIASIVQKATQMSGWVLRTFYTRERQPMMILYKSLILSRLDYCCALWNPNGSAQLIDKIESVQRSFTRKIQGMNGLNYWERLQSLRLYSVQRRRERYVILYVFKILHGLVPNCGITFNENLRTGIRAVVPIVKNTLPSHIRKLRSNSFTHVAPLLYNLLPTCMRRMYIEKDPLSVFKRELDSVLYCVPDEPTIPGLFRNVKSNSLVHQMTSYII